MDKSLSNAGTFPKAGLTLDSLVKPNEQLEMNQRQMWHWRERGID